MIILHEGSVFEYDTANPSSTVSGSKTKSTKTWRYCPYSTQITDYNQDVRIPNGEKVYHPETNGRLHSYSLGGAMGWICSDNACPYFLGIATTAVPQAGRRFQVAPSIQDCGTIQMLATLSGSVQHLTGDRVIVSGTRQRYYEI